MALHAVHHVAILVSDYQASRHFYVDLLGFTVLRENFRPEKNDWKLDLILDGVELEIFSAPAAPPRPDPAGGAGSAASGLPGGGCGAGGRGPGCQRHPHRAHPDGPLFPKAVYLFPGPGRPAAGTA